MILHSALVLLAASTFQIAAADPIKMSVLPPDCGLTEQQVIDLAFPDYRQHHTNPTTQDDRAHEDYYHAAIVAALTTSFGKGYGRFLIAAVDLRNNKCDFCQKTALLVIDQVTHALAWRSDSEGVSEPTPDWDGKALRLTRLFPDDPVLSLAYRWDTIGCAFGCGAARIYEEWLRPQLTATSSLVFDQAWGGEVGGYQRGDEWDHVLDGEMHSMWPKRGYKFTQHIRAGWNAAGEFDRSLDLIVNQEFAQDPSTMKLLPGATTLARHDSHPSSVFPFSLPIRALVFEADLLPPGGAKSGLNSVLSPDGRFVVERKRGGAGEARLDIRRSGESSPIREIWSERPAGGKSFREELDGLEFVSVGWTPEVSRCLVIVELGLQSGDLKLPPVLVSLTPDGKGDRWEGFLPEGYQLPDGFILDLPEPGAKALMPPKAH